MYHREIIVVSCWLPVLCSLAEFFSFMVASFSVLVKS